MNFDPQVKAIFLKMLSAKLCCSVLGQIGIDCVVKPPKPGEPSYELFKKEKDDVLNGLKRKAEIVARTFNSIQGRPHFVAFSKFNFIELRNAN